MRRTMLLLCLTAAVVLPEPSQARSVSGAVFGLVTAPLRLGVPGFSGRRVAHRARHHRHQTEASRRARHRPEAKTSTAREDRAAPPAGAAAQPPGANPADTAGAAAAAGAAGATAAGAAAAGAPGTAGAAAASGEPAWVGAVYWPQAADNMFAAVLQPASDVSFWAHGARDLLGAIFTSASAPTGSTAACGLPRDAAGWREELARIVPPTEAQGRAYDELSAALAAASETLKPNCASTTTSVRAPERLDAMTDRLWTMRRASVLLRAPLQKFVKALNDDQKRRLTATPEDATTGSTTPQPKPETALPCVNPAAALLPWPNEDIERRVRPSNEQRQPLQMLQQTALGMGQLLRASCPPSEPGDAVARLDAVENRLNAMLYAARVTAPALQGAYGPLSDPQRTAFDAVKSPGMPSADAMARGAK